MSFILLGILNSQAAAGGISYWIASYSSALSYTRTVPVTNINNKILVSNNSATGFAYSILNADGSVATQGAIAGTLGYLVDAYFSVATKSNGNFIVGGRAYTGSGVRKPALYEITDSGSVVNRFIYDMGSANNAEIINIRTDSSDNVYFSSYWNNSYYYVAKLDSNLNLLWNTRNSSGGNGRYFDFFSDGSSLTGLSQDIWKLSSAGSGLGLYLQDFNTQVNLTNLTIDRTSNVVAYSGIEKSTNKSGVLFANSSLTVQAGRKFAQNKLYPNQSGLAFDSTGNLYYAFPETFSGYEGIVLAKLNSSGSVLWIRNIRATNNKNLAMSPNNVSVDSNDDVLVGYFFAGTTGNFPVTMKLPADGSLTGTYAYQDGADIVYEPSAIGSSSHTSTTTFYSQGGSAQSTTKVDFSSNSTVLTTAHTPLLITIQENQLFIDPNGNFPRYLGDLLIENPSYKEGDSLPAGWIPVIEVEPPAFGKYEILELGQPIESNGVYTQTWQVRAMTTAEKELVDAPENAKAKLLALGLTEIEIQALAQGLVR